MDAEELINDLWEILLLDMSDSDKVYSMKDRIQEWAEEVDHPLPEIDEELVEEIFDE